MFEKELNAILCDIKDLAGKKYVTAIKKREDTVGIDTSKSHHIFIQESVSRKDQVLKYNSGTKLYNIEKYFDIILQYEGQKNEKMECDILNYIVTNYSEAKYFDDRKYIFKLLTGDELKRDIQFFFITFVLQINTLNKPCNW